MAVDITEDEVVAEIVDWLDLDPVSKDKGWVTMEQLMEVTDIGQTTIYRRLMAKVRAGEMERVKFGKKYYYRRVNGKA